jgi:hypothetical protein
MNFEISIADRHCSSRLNPASFNDVIGHDSTIEKLREWAKHDDRRGGLLLCGPDGVGKRTLAHVLGKAILCESPLADASPCGRCDNCHRSDEGRVTLGYVSFDAAASKSEESLRSFLAGSRGNSLAYKQVIIIENVDRFEPQEADIFLKTLEEPPKDTTFILLATEMKGLRLAVRSRCRPRFFLRPLTKYQAHKLAERMATAFEIETDKDVLSLVALLSRGLPGQMADALRKLAGMKTSTVDEALGVLELDWPDAMIAHWLTVLTGREPEEGLRANVASGGPGESMRRLRALLNHLFAHEFCEPKCDVLVDPALEYMDQRAWNELVHRFDQEAVAKTMSRTELWRILTSTCLSSDHEHAADAIVAATAAASQAKKIN